MMVGERKGEGRRMKLDIGRPDRGMWWVITCFKADRSDNYIMLSQEG